MNSRSLHCSSKSTIKALNDNGIDNKMDIILLISFVVLQM